jgi:hypothetical protein
MMTDTADFRNPNYHKPTDTVESLDSDRLTKVVRALAFAAHAIADGDAIMPLSAPPTPDPSPPPQETPAEPAPK